MSTARIYDRPLTPGSRIGILLLIAIAGLLYVKWMPYYSRAFLAASTHSIGKSILMGAAAQAPAVSWRSALDFVCLLLIWPSLSCRGHGPRILT